MIWCLSLLREPANDQSSDVINARSELGNSTDSLPSRHIIDRVEQAPGSVLDIEYVEKENAILVVHRNRVVILRSLSALNKSKSIHIPVGRIRDFIGDHHFRAARMANEKTLLFSDGKSAVHKWDLESNAEVWSFTDHSSPVEIIRSVPNTDLVVSQHGVYDEFDSRNSIKIWNYRTLAIERKFVEWSSAIGGKLRVSGDGRVVISEAVNRAGEREFRIWDVGSNRELTSLSTGDIRLRAEVQILSPDAREVMCLDEDGKVVVRSVGTGIDTWSLEPTQFEACCRLYAVSGDQVLLETTNSHLYLWDNALKKSVSRQTSIAGEISCVRVYASHGLVLIGLNDGGVYVLDLKTLEVSISWRMDSSKSPMRKDRQE